MQTFTLALFGVVGIDIVSATVRAQLEGLDPKTRLLVQINSDGGSVSEATAIYNMLRVWPGGVEVEILGWALSGATQIAMAGRPIRAHETSVLMVHAPHTDRGGNARELRETAETLDTVTAAMRHAYSRSGQPASVIDGWLDGQDHWFTAAEARDAGLIDEVITAGAMAAAPVNASACRYRVPLSIIQRLNTTMPQSTTPTPADIRAEGIRIEAQRRADIRDQFSHFIDRTDIGAEMRSLQAACETDLACTPVDAGKKVLALLARDVTSAAGGNWYVGNGARGDSRMDDFKAAACDVLQARAGIKVAQPHPATKDLARMSVVQMAERMLSLRGISTRDMSRGDIVSQGLDTSDLKNLLSNLAGKSLRNGYATAPITFSGWSGERTVVDFKLQTLVSLSEAPDLLKVPELSEYKFGALTDSATNFKIETFGRVLAISRQALINDDLSAFTNIPNAFGMSARRLEADLVYSALTSNPNMNDGVPLFHPTHGNLASAGDKPNVQSLGLARAAMRLQRDIGGVQYVDPQPRYLIVPVALETLCEQLLASLLDPNEPSRQVANIEWVRRLTLVSDPRLDASSSIAWYLAADPSQIEGVVRAYLQGEDRPHLEENTEFNRDAVSTKARLDIGVGVVDWRGLYKNPGS